MVQDDSCGRIDNADALAAMLGTATGGVFALFYASWCPFCTRFLPAFRLEAQGKQGHFVAVQDDDELLAARYAIDVYPTVLFIEKGSVSKRLDGVPGVGLDERQLSEFIVSCPIS